MNEDAAWRAHEVRQLQRWALLSPKQRLDWLWSAKLFALKALGAAAARRETEAAREEVARDDGAPTRR